MAVETVANKEGKELKKKESIEFFLKITLRHKRKNARVSTLDTI
jgi:hypothetical protein